VEKPINLTRDALIELLNNEQTKPAVTIYTPTHRAATPPNMSEDQIRCKNMIHKALSILKKRHDGRELEAELSEQLEAMLADRDFWEHQTEGLLMCARPGQISLYHLPVDTEEYVAVADHFHLAPMFGFLRDMQEYYVLVVAQHEPALFKGDAYDVVATSIKMPETLAEGLNLDEIHQKSEQQRSAGSSSGGSASYNGRGGDRDPAEDDRIRFWRLLDQMVCDKVGTKLPLILAGTDSELSEYRSISHYPNIMQLSEGGSFGGFKPHELFATATSILRREVEMPDKLAVIEEYRRAKGQAPDQATKGMAAIKEAAENGRIDKLLVGDIRYTADTVQDGNAHVPLITFPSEEELAQAVQDIAYAVWNTGGSIVNMDSENMPEPGEVLLATLRY
jgi:hypothetical protein